MHQPNIVYLHSHDTGRCVQPYGFGVHTPRLQQLAERGMMFRNAHCAAPTCSPSRAALLTGMTAHQSGMLGLGHRGHRLADYSKHLNFTLKAAGYLTVLAGFQHLARLPFADPKLLGYDEHVVSGEFDGAENRAAAFLSNKPRKPFFLDVGFFETHRYGPPLSGFSKASEPAGDPRYVQPPSHLPDMADVRRDFADFAAAATLLDQKIGHVLDAIDAAGLSGNTLIICTTDHGIPFPGAKCCLTDHGTGVMLFLCGPGGFVGGGVIDAMVSHIDLFPTICDVAGISPPAWLQGQSLAPLARGEIARVHDTLFGEVTFHAAYEPMRSVRTERWKYIRRFEPRERPVLSNMDDGISKSVMVLAGMADGRPADESLFDLLLDPDEARNLAESPEQAAVLREMRDRLDRWMRETHDPLLAGPVPLPAGGINTSSDAYSPSGEPGGPDHALQAPPTKGMLV